MLKRDQELDCQNNWNTFIHFYEKMGTLYIWNMAAGRSKKENTRMRRKC